MLLRLVLLRLVLLRLKIMWWLQSKHTIPSPPLTQPTHTSSKRHKAEGKIKCLGVVLRAFPLVTPPRGAIRRRRHASEPMACRHTDLEGKESEDWFVFGTLRSATGRCDKPVAVSQDTESTQRVERGARIQRTRDEGSASRRHAPKLSYQTKTTESAWSAPGSQW